VDYEYNIATYEVTAGQYAEFLNAVAATDAYGLYNTFMGVPPYGCQIERSGTSGSYAYSVAGDYADRPVNYVSWGDAARFANWLHNGQPSGTQGPSTTEDGAYELNGATSQSELDAVNRETDWLWAIPTEDEWYKAAYHKNDGATGNYFDYPTSSDTTPTNVAPPGGGNSANYFWAVPAPYYRNEVGAYTSSASPYGTSDQGGNVSELTEARLSFPERVCRGGDLYRTETLLHANYRYGWAVTTEDYYVGFRVVSRVPEPGSLLLLILGGAGIVARRRRVGA
jgi:formylglycine-generating enzyme required for sulfatase activity